MSRALGSGVSFSRSVRSTMGAEVGDFPMGGNTGGGMSSTDSNCVENSGRSLALGALMKSSMVFNFHK